MKEKKIKVLMATPELKPFSEVGGLGDVAKALPKALHDLKVDVRLITPLYGFIDRRAYRLRKVAGLEDFSIRVGNYTHDIRFFRSKLPDSSVQVFFVECDDFFEREGVYSDPSTGQGYWDNPQRFILFNKAIVQFLHTDIFPADIIHLNDNQTALVAPLLRTLEENAGLSKKPIVMGIHNAQHQGTYSMAHLYYTDLDIRLTYPGGPFEFYGDFNFLKAGISYSDKLLTVSETYAEETMQSSDFGFGLEGVLAERRKDYRGILNGVDYKDWSPDKDSLIPYNYSPQKLSGKAKCKKKLLKLCGFTDSDPKVPLIGLISRLVYQKGIDILLGALPQLLEDGINMVILGTGEAQLHEALEDLQKRFPEKLALFLKFDNELAHLIEAGCDMFLMPSRFEPCGLNQLYSLRYGTIPIVRKTGGLADTVRNYEPALDDGWGFVFSGFNSEELASEVWRAVDAFHDKTKWLKIMKRAMKQDFSWEKSAQKYKQLYVELLNGEG